MEGDGGAGLVLHGPDIPDDVAAAQLLGADHAAQSQGGHNAALVRVAQLGDDLGNALGDTIQGDDHIQLVKARQRHQCIALGEALAFQKVLVGGVPVDDLCPRQQGAQLAAPGGAVVHNDSLVAR